MILRPLNSPVPAAAYQPEPVWPAIAEQQMRVASAYWLISQPDHAELSGTLAANFVSASFPPVEACMARAIAVHDSGWAIFPAETSAAAAPPLSDAGKPLAFTEFAPHDSVRAWAGSINAAEEICPAGGVIVSRHFRNLAHFRLRAGIPPQESQALHGFLQREEARQQRLLPRCAYSAPELDRLLEVLQFCDLLSLYLCSGVQHEVEFPQRLTPRKVRISRPPGEDFYRLDPSPFQTNGHPRFVTVDVAARYYPLESEPKLTKLEFRLA